MKRALSTLKKEAQRYTSLRGHRMKWGNPYCRASGPRMQIGKCRDCGMEVQLNEAPAPNGIDIGGEAVALNCRKK